MLQYFDVTEERRLFMTVRRAQMDRITSRKNPFIAQLRALGADARTRREQGVFVCDGLKLLGEAAANGAEIV